MPTAEDVQVEVPHALPGVIAVIHDQPVAVGVAGIRGDAPDDLQKTSTEPLVLEIGQLCDVDPRHDQHMQWRRRTQIGEGDGVTVLMHERGRDLARDDAAEDAVPHGW